MNPQSQISLTFSTHYILMRCEKHENNVDHVIMVFLRFIPR